MGDGGSFCIGQVRRNLIINLSEFEKLGFLIAKFVNTCSANTRRIVLFHQLADLVNHSP